MTKRLDGPKQFVMFSLILLIAYPSVVFPVQARPEQQLQSADIATWSETHIGTRASSVEQTHDRGYLVAGSGSGSWVIKLNAEGKTEWDKYYTPSGYTDSSLSGSHAETKDGGYILAGNAVSVGYATSVDAWLLKLDRRGEVEWSKTYGGPKYDYFTMAEQTSDGGYIAVGNTELASSHTSNGWVMKLDPVGNVVWEEAFVGEDVHSVSRTNDEGFLLSGAVGLPDNAVAVWVLKLDSSGKAVWQFAYDPVNGSYPVNVRWTSSRQTSDGGYVVSADVIRWGLFNTPVPPEKLFLRLDERGKILWQKWYAVEASISRNSSIEETHDLGFIVAGGSSPSNPSKPAASGPWLLRLDGAGNIIWQRSYGESYDYFVQAQETKDNGFIVGGQLLSLGSAWILKMDAEGRINGCLAGVLLNSTVTDAQDTVSVIAIPSTATHATVVGTSVAVTALQVAFVHTQCAHSPDDGALDQRRHRVEQRPDLKFRWMLGYYGEERADARVMKR